MKNSHVLNFSTYFIEKLCFAVITEYLNPRSLEYLCIWKLCKIL